MKKLSVSVIIIALSIIINSCYIAGENTDISDPAIVSLNLPGNQTFADKASASGTYMLEVFFFNYDYIMENQENIEELITNEDEWFYYKEFNLGDDVYPGDLVEITIDNIRTSENYFAMAYYYFIDITGEYISDDTFFISTEPFSVEDGKTTVVNMMSYSVIEEPVLQ